MVIRRLVPVLILVTGGATLVAGSRGGIVALLAAPVVMLGLSVRGPSPAGRAAYLAVGTALIILAAAWLGGDVLHQIVARLAFEVSRPEEGARSRLWLDALGLVRASPWLGSGLGAFGWGFPPFRTRPAPVTYTHAESDWVELLTGVGLVGAGLALLLLAAIGFAVIRGSRHAQRPEALALAAAAALVGAAVQGIGNFSMPVMCNLVFLALLVVGACVNHRSGGAP